ncbi:MAG: hypothetical protein O7H40_18285 [Gammaproteobacteria bacterium]|nr:hypothetical protein [Gammaproteobacteria bacterium]
MNDDADVFVGPKTEVINMSGRIVMPGLHDLHIHFTLDSEETEFGCHFSEDAGPDEIVATVAACIEADAHQTRGWVIGESWNACLAERPGRCNKRLLDAVAPDDSALL